MTKDKYTVCAVDFTDEPDTYKRVINARNESMKTRGYVEEFCKKFPNAKTWRLVITHTNWRESVKEFDGALVKSVAFYVAAHTMTTNPMNDVLFVEIEPVF